MNAYDIAALAAAGATVESAERIVAQIDKLLQFPDAAVSAERKRDLVALRALWVLAADVYRDSAREAVRLHGGGVA